VDFGLTKEQTLLAELVDRMVKENIALERFYRDMDLHMLHDRDIVAQIVGASELGEPFDLNQTH